MMAAPGGVAADDNTWGRGTRRKRLAGYVRAANELRQSYQKSWNDTAHHLSDDPDHLGIPGAFPEVHVARGGNEELILFPSYARRHTKKSKSLRSYPSVSGKAEGAGDAEYWRKEWQEYEDANAVVDVDVRGWIYAPHRGALNRKNRLVLGIARQLSGIPAPPSSSEAESEPHHSSDRIVGKIAQEQAQEIAEHGEREARLAQSGGYGNSTSISDRERSYPSSRQPSPRPSDSSQYNPEPEIQDGGALIDPIKKRQSWNQPSNMSRNELAIANAHLLKRLQPFFATAAVNMPITIFYFNDETSQSRTTTTNESGHFNFRVALPFIPTQVRVLASENLSASADVLITEPKGISLISDIDDTIKYSAINGGAKEIFRNAFIREFGDLTIPGVREWYAKLHDMGVKLHYLSNSPWQMYPLLVSFFAQAGLPPGSFHLKQYAGMLQGIFEPVAERKKGTMNRIMNDFPERRFIMVGDSGEADLELYVETALQYRGRILAIYIRDVTTSPSKISYEATGQFFTGSRSSSPATTPKESISPASPSPSLMPRAASDPSIMDEEDLIDLSDEHFTTSPDLALQRSVTNGSITSRKVAPPLPDKPARLRSPSNANVLGSGPTEPPPLNTTLSSAHNEANAMVPARRVRPRPPVPPKSATTLSIRPRLHRDRQTYSPSSDRDASADRTGYRAAVRRKVGEVYNRLPSSAASVNGNRSVETSSVHSTSSSSGAVVGTVGSDDKLSPQSSAVKQSSPLRVEAPAPPLPPRRGLSSYPAAAAHYASGKLWGTNTTGGPPAGPNTAGGSSTLGPPAAGNRRENLWRQRLAQARTRLQGTGVSLRVWRVGEDLLDESVALVQKAQCD